MFSGNLRDILQVAAVITIVESIQLTPEADNYISNVITTKNNSSNTNTVLLYQNEVLNIEFCLDRPRMAIISTRYVTLMHNDSHHCLAFSLDGTLIREQELPDVGQGTIDLAMDAETLSAGRHILTLKVVKTNIFGVGIDSFTIEIEGNTENSVACKGICLDNIVFPISQSRERLPAARIIQQSHPTLCAEVDNINIPIYHATPGQYTITALSPMYRTFFNQREADFENCAMASPVWEFEGIQILNNFHITIYSGKTVLVTSETFEFNTVSIHFHISGTSNYSVIGSGISLKFQIDSLSNNFGEIKVGCSFYGQERKWSTVMDRTISGTEVARWSVPDDTWSIEVENIVRFYIAKDVKLNIEYITMRNREQAEDRIFSIYKDARVIIEGVEVDFWWLGHRSMTLRRIDSSDEFQDASYFRIYRRVPWRKNSFSQVFVMYQDGNVRLLPITPHGLDWIPFGSSVLIGQTDLNATRPYALIEHVDIDPLTMTLHIRYANGDFTTLEVHESLVNTTVRVKNITLRGDRSRQPLLTFRSMWVRDGNCDVDSVSVEGEEPHPILSGWTELDGNDFTFFRRCFSKHNSLSPDIHISFDDQI